MLLAATRRPCCAGPCARLSRTSAPPSFARRLERVESLSSFLSLNTSLNGYVRLLKHNLYVVILTVFPRLSPGALGGITCQRLPV